MNTKLGMLIMILMELTATMIAGCSSVPRTKWTDKSMRVMIDPSSIDPNNYVRIQQALVASGKWVVVDRAMGFKAMKAEQEREHRTESDRYQDREKWSHWGKMYGVGGIVVAHAQCQNKDGFWAGRYAHCHQFLSIMDANTGNVIATADNQENGDIGETDIAPSWEDTVDALNDNYPSHFEKNKDDKIIDDYKDLSAEEAQRQKEVKPASVATEAAAAK